MLTIFSAPKSFEGHIAIIQQNAIGSWLQLGDDVEVLLIGDEEGMGDIARKYKVQHLPEVECNALGTPLVSSIFQLAQEAASYSTMCYVNADIILMDDFLKAVHIVKERFQEFLMIGQRWDLEKVKRINFQGNWKSEIRLDLDRKGRLHPPAGSDYFVYKRGTFTEMPPFALGRAGWDNWMIYAGRAGNIPVVDATHAAAIIHQDHDYAHLPNGQPHYRLPESDENVRLSGGQDTIFTLSDADWILAGEVVRRKSWRERWSLRGIEASVISRFGPGIVTRLSRMCLHPRVTFSYYLEAAKRRVKLSPRVSTRTDEERE